MDINHIGLTVPDIDAAVAFYRDVFGLTVLVEPQLHSLDTPHGDRRRDVFGPGWGGMKLAHLVSASGCGIELFEFVLPATVAPAEAFDYATVGVSHICLTSRDFDADIARIVDHGGRRRSRVHTVWQGVRICYCEDPWGNVIEVSSADYRSIVGPGRMP